MIDLPARIKAAQDEYARRHQARPAQKLTDEQVLAMMAEWEQPLPPSDTELGFRFGVSSSCVTRIRTGWSWRRITGFVKPSDRPKKTPMGESHPGAILTANQAREIYLADLPFAQLAKMYGVSINSIRAIRHHKRWRSVTIGLPRPIGLAARRGQRIRGAVWP